MIRRRRIVIAIIAVTVLVAAVGFVLPQPEPAATVADIKPSSRNQSVARSNPAIDDHGSPGQVSVSGKVPGQPNQVPSPVFQEKVLPVQDSPARLLANAKDLAAVMDATEQWEAGLTRSCVRSNALGACGLANHMVTQAGMRFDAQTRSHAAAFQQRWCSGFRQFEKQVQEADDPVVIAELFELLDEDGGLDFDGTEPRYSRDEFAVLELELETLARFGKGSSASHYRAALRSLLDLGDPACAVGAGLLTVVDQNDRLSVFDDLRRPGLSQESFRKALELAIELYACQSSQACGPDSPLTIRACYEAGQCRPNESIVDLRRRTVEPGIFQSAQQILPQLARLVEAH